MRVVIHFDLATKIRYESDLRPWVVRLYPIKAKIFPSQINYEAMYRVKGYHKSELLVKSNYTHAQGLLKGTSYALFGFLLI